MPNVFTPLVTSGGHHWRPVQTCSLGLTAQTPSTGTDIWWPPKHILLASGRYASYWNGFLFLVLWFLFPDFCLPPTKLGKGNVFIGVCSSEGPVPCPFWGGYLWCQVPSRGRDGYVQGMGIHPLLRPETSGGMSTNPPTKPRHCVILSFPSGNVQ